MFGARTSPVGRERDAGRGQRGCPAAAAGVGRAGQRREVAGASSAGALGAASEGLVLAGSPGERVVCGCRRRVLAQIGYWFEFLGKCHVERYSFLAAF